MGFWLKDNKIIVKNSKLVNCDKCPCGDGCSLISYVDGWLLDVNGNMGEGIDWASKTYNIEGFEQTVSIEEGNIGISGFTCPTKTKSIKGSLSVTFAAGIDECSIDIAMGMLTGDYPIVWTSPCIVKANGARTVSVNFTVAWGTGDQGDGYYLSWA